MPPENTITNTAPAAAKAKAPASDKKKKTAKRAVILIIALLLISIPLYLLFKSFLTPKTKLGDKIDIAQSAQKAGGDEEKNKELTVLKEENEPKMDQSLAQSENFKLTQINLEGSGANVFDFGENELLSFSDITSQLYYSKGEKNEIRAVISAKTSRRAYAEVEYFKSGEKAKKAVKDISAGFNHILVLPDLEPDSVYKYTLTAADLNQIKLASDQYVFYTGSGNVSLVDVLEEAAQKVFGWVIGE